MLQLFFIMIYPLLGPSGMEIIVLSWFVFITPYFLLLIFYFFSSSSLLTCKQLYKLLGRVKQTGWLTQRDKQEGPLRLSNICFFAQFHLLPTSQKHKQFCCRIPYSFLIIPKQQCKIAGRSWLHAVLHKYVSAERWDVI